MFSFASQIIKRSQRIKFSHGLDAVFFNSSQNHRYQIAQRIKFSNRPAAAFFNSSQKHRYQIAPVN